MKDYYQVLKIERSATKAEIRKAYLELAKRHHPDKHPLDGDLTLASEEFALITKAYQILMDDKRRQKYDHELATPGKATSPEVEAAKIQAQTSFKHGLIAFDKQEFPRAELYFRASVKLNPEVAKYRSYLGVAIASQGKEFKEAESHCNKAIEMEIYNPEHYVNLGFVYAAKGEKQKAKDQFEHALEWNPGHARARRGLRELESGKKGGFGKLFKKRR